MPTQASIVRSGLFCYTYYYNVGATLAVASELMGLSCRYDRKTEGLSSRAKRSGAEGSTQLRYEPEENSVQILRFSLAAQDNIARTVEGTGSCMCVDPLERKTV